MVDAEGRRGGPVEVRRPPRWARVLPAGLACLGAVSLAGYLLFAPVTTLPDGTPASALAAANPFLLSLAALVVAGGAVGLVAAAVGRQRLLWGAALGMALLGSLPTAVGPQVLIVALLLLVAATLERITADRPVLLVVAGVLTLLAGGLLWLTALTGPPEAGALALVGFVGASLAVVSAVDGGARGRRHRAVALLVVAVLVGAAAVPTLGVLEPDEPRVPSFSAERPRCVEPGEPDRSASLHSTGFARTTLVLEDAVAVNGTGHALTAPEPVRTGPRNYTVEVSSRETGDGRACAAAIPYALRLRLPRTTGGTTTLVVTHDGTPVTEVRVRPDGIEVTSGTEVTPDTGVPSS